MPELAMPRMPEMPAFERTSFPDRSGRIEEIKAHRAQAKQEADARRAALKEMSERRRVDRPMGRSFGPRPVSYRPAMMGPAMMAPGSECAPQTSVVAAPVQAEAPAPAAPEVQAAVVPTEPKQ